MKALKYLYYKFYRMAKVIGNTSPEWQAIVSLGGFLIIWTVPILKYPFNTFIRAHQEGFKYILVILGLVLAGALMYHFMYKDKYLVVIKQFENESNRERIRGNWIVGISLIIGLLLSVFRKAIMEP